LIHWTLGPFEFWRLVFEIKRLQMIVSVTILAIDLDHLAIPIVPTDLVQLVFVPPSPSRAYLDGWVSSHCSIVLQPGCGEYCLVKPGLVGAGIMLPAHRQGGQTC